MRMTTMALNSRLFVLMCRYATAHSLTHTSLMVEMNKMIQCNKY